MMNPYGFNPMFGPSMACPQCGFVPTWMGQGTMAPSYGPGMMGPGFGGPTTWAGTYPSVPPYGPGYYGRGFESWPADDQIRDMIFDAIDADPVVPYESDINVEVTGGVVTLTGTVPSKRIKHALGDDAW